jgi:tetratricopeptide (TPR) repeat protein
MTERSILQQQGQLKGASYTQPVCGRPIRRKGRLESVVLQDGELQISAAASQFPQCLVEANNALKTGDVHLAKGILDGQAVEAVCGIVEKDPARTDIMFVLATLYGRTRNFAKAAQWYKRILEQEQSPIVYNELGLVCQCMGQLSPAERYQREAIRLAPDEPRFWPNLAVIFIETGRTQQGIGLLRKAVDRLACDCRLHSSLLFYLHFLPELDPHKLFTEHQRWGRIHAPLTLAQAGHSNNPEPERRLRVGYIFA